MERRTERTQAGERARFGTMVTPTADGHVLAIISREVLGQQHDVSFYKP